MATGSFGASQWSASSGQCWSDPRLGALWLQRWTPGSDGGHTHHLEDSRLGPAGGPGRASGLAVALIFSRQLQLR